MAMKPEWGSRPGPSSGLGCPALPLGPERPVLGRRALQRSGRGVRHTQRSVRLSTGRVRAPGTPPCSHFLSRLQTAAPVLASGSSPWRCPFWNFPQTDAPVRTPLRPSGSPGDVHEVAESGAPRPPGGWHAGMGTASMVYPFSCRRPVDHVQARPLSSTQRPSRPGFLAAAQAALWCASA